MNWQGWCPASVKRTVIQISIMALLVTGVGVLFNLVWN